MTTIMVLKYKIEKEGKSISMKEGRESGATGMDLCTPFGHMIDLSFCHVKM